MRNVISSVRLLCLSVAVVWWCDPVALTCSDACDACDACGGVFVK